MQDSEVAPNVHAIAFRRVAAHAILDDDGVTLVDTGYAGSLPRLVDGLAGLGRTVADVRRVVWARTGILITPAALERLEEIRGPVLSVAAAADTIYDNPMQGVLASMIANAFPLAREGGVRKSLELLGARLDRGFDILLDPEGKLTLGGPLQPFKAGAGLIAVEGGTPVVPIRIVVHEMSWIDRRRWPSPLRGDVEVVVGDPIWFDADMDHAATTTRLEAAVAAL